MDWHKRSPSLVLNAKLLTLDPDCEWSLCYLQLNNLSIYLLTYYGSYLINHDDRTDRVKRFHFNRGCILFLDGKRTNLGNHSTDSLLNSQLSKKILLHLLNLPSSDIRNPVNLVEEYGLPLTGNSRQDTVDQGILNCSFARCQVI